VKGKPEADPLLNCIITATNPKHPRKLLYNGVPGLKSCKLVLEGKRTCTDPVEITKADKKRNHNETAISFFSAQMENEGLHNYSRTTSHSLQHQEVQLPYWD
jgi:hypothetical protein